MAKGMGERSQKGSLGKGHEEMGRGGTKAMKSV